MDQTCPSIVTVNVAGETDDIMTLHHLILGCSSLL